MGERGVASISYSLSIGLVLYRAGQALVDPGFDSWPGHSKHDLLGAPLELVDVP